MPRAENLKRVAILTLYVVLTSILSSFALFAGRGLEIEGILEKVQFYYGLLVFAFIGILLLAFSNFIAKNREKGLFKALSGFAIHNPEMNIFNDLNIPSLKAFSDGRKLFMIFAVVFFIAGLFAVYQETFFTASIPFGEIEFQATKTADVALQVYPASPAETLTFQFLLFLFANALRYYIVIKNKQPKIIFWLILLIIVAPIFGGGGWLAYHLVRYGADETALLGNFLFGMIGSILSFVFASIIPWLLMHDSNNFFERINDLFANETILGIYLTILLTIIIPLFVLIWIRINKQRATQVVSG